MQNYLNLIEAEVNRAKTLHPNNGIDLNHSIVILTEEVGEAAKAALDYQHKGKSIQDLRDELIQCGAMVIRSLELIENYPDVKVTAAETTFKVGDRVEFEEYTAEIVTINYDTQKATIEYKECIVCNGFDTSASITEHKYVPLTDLTLITNETT